MDCPREEVEGEGRGRPLHSTLLPSSGLKDIHGFREEDMAVAVVAAAVEGLHLPCDCSHFPRSNHDVLRFD